ncbi:MAG: hypothetical protein IH944_14235 [Armatimonadetes bacterium]|nr:hypothetical protein [Armatimonadota bacterium]
MLNILPVIMLLLVQGFGDVDSTSRHQQALLDLAQKVGAVQTIEELEDLLSEAPGLDAHQIASWLGAFYALSAETNSTPELPEEEVAGCRIAAASDEPLLEYGFLSSARTRDGPSL